MQTSTCCTIKIYICILSCAYYNSIQILNIYIIPHFGINKNKLAFWGKIWASSFICIIFPLYKQQKWTTFYVGKALFHLFGGIQSLNAMLYSHFILNHFLTPPDSLSELSIQTSSSKKFSWRNSGYEKNESV